MLQNNKSTIVLTQYVKDFRLQPTEIELIANKMRPLSIKKGAILQQEGRICRKMCILVDGLLYAYYGVEKENVFSFFYTPKNSIVTIFDSFKNRKPSEKGIKALEDSLLYYFTYQDLEELYRKIPSMNTIGRKFIENIYIQALERIQSLQELDTEQRFRNFFKENPTLLNRVQRQHLASYLRMNRNLIAKYLKEF